MNVPTEVLQAAARILSVNGVAPIEIDFDLLEDILEDAGTIAEWLMMHADMDEEE